MERKQLVAGIGIVFIVVIVAFMLSRVNGRGPLSSYAQDSDDARYSGNVASVGVMAPSYDGAVAEMAMAPSQRLAVGKVAMPITPPEPGGYQTGGGAEFIPKEPLIIKTGYLSLSVADVPTAIDSIVTLVKGKGGDEVNRNVSKNSYVVDTRAVSRFVGSVTVRVPSAQFEETMASLKQFGDVESQQVNGQDVTEEYVDIQAQLKNYRATETQYLEIMKKAQKIEDILNVQARLGDIRAQIDRLEGRTKYLQQSSDKSTITVSLSTKPENVPVVEESDKWKPAVAFKNALRSLIGVAKQVGDAVIWAVVYLPVLLLIGLVVWIIRRRHRATAPTMPPASVSRPTPPRR